MLWLFCGKNMDPITQMFIDNQGQRLTAALINGFNVTIRGEIGSLTDALVKAEAERDDLLKKLDAALQDELSADGLEGAEMKKEDSHVA